MGLHRRTRLPKSAFSTVSEVLYSFGNNLSINTLRKFDSDIARGGETDGGHSSFDGGTPGGLEGVQMQFLSIPGMKMEGQRSKRENLSRLPPWAAGEEVRINRRVSYFREP